MTEEEMKKQESPSQKPTPKLTARQESKMGQAPRRLGGSRRNILAGFMLLVCLIGVGLLGGLYWTQEQKIRVIEESIESKVSKVSDAHLKTEGSLTQVKDELQKLEKIPEELSLIAMRVAKLADSRQWELSEVQYLIHIAFERLQVLGDISTAILQCQEADKKLYQMGDPTLNPVRQILAKDIAKLQAVTLPDKQGIWAKLSALKEELNTFVVNAQSLEQLQTEHLAENTKPTPSASKAQSSSMIDPSRWKKALKGTWHEIKGLVKIRHKGETSVPILTEQEQMQIQGTMVLFLEQAKWAVIAGDQALYTTSLKDALEWVNTYFAPSEATQSVVKNLEGLIATKIKIDVPEISSSVNAIDQAIKNSRLMQQMGDRPRGAG